MGFVQLTLLFSLNYRFLSLIDTHFYIHFAVLLYLSYKAYVLLWFNINLDDDKLGW